MRAVYIEIAHTLEADSSSARISVFSVKEESPRQDTAIMAPTLLARNESWEEHVCDRLRKDDVQWYFNSTAVSHQGGMWERKIRSVRKILDALLKEQRIKDETQTTLLCVAERILDDRPLASLSDSPNNPEPLTLNKLWLRKSNTYLPLDVFKE